MFKFLKNNISKSSVISFLVCALPFFAFSTFLIDQMLIPRMLISAVVLIILFFYILKSKSSSIESLSQLMTHPLSLIHLLFALVILSGIPRSLDPNTSILIIAKHFILFSYTLILLALLREKIVKSTHLINSLLFVVFCSIIIALAQFIRTEGFFMSSDFIYQINSWFGNKNNLSFALFLGISLLLLSLEEKNKVVNGLFFSVVLICLLYLQSRSVLLSAAAASLVAFLYYLSEKKKFPLSRRQLIYTSVAFVFLAGFIVLLNKRFEMESMQLLQRMFAIFEIKGQQTISNYTVQERWELWTSTFQLIQERPIQGYGSSNWRFLFPTTDIENLRVAQGEIIFQRAHNDWLQAWMENGVLGLIAITTFLTTPLILALKYRGKMPTIHVAVLLFTSIGWALISFLDFPNESFVLLLLLQSIYILSIYNLKLAPIVKIPKRLAWFIPVILSCSLFFLIRQGLGEYKAKVLLENRGVQGKTHVIHQAGNDAIKKGYKVDYTSTPISSYIGEAYLATGQFKEAQVHLLDAEKINPTHLMNLHNLGLSYIMQKDTLNAFNSWNKVLKISPRFELTRHALIHINFENGEFGAAMCHYKNLPAYRKSPQTTHYTNTLFKSYIVAFAQNETIKPLQDKLLEISANEKWMTYVLNESIIRDRELSEQLILESFFENPQLSNYDKEKTIYNSSLNNNLYYICPKQ